jgi:hypothetical protein
MTEAVFCLTVNQMFNSQALANAIQLWLSDVNDDGAFFGMRCQVAIEMPAANTLLPNSGEESFILCFVSLLLFSVRERARHKLQHLVKLETKK